MAESAQFSPDRAISEQLHPEVPARIGPYALHLSWQELLAGGGDFAFHIQGADGDYIILGDVVGHGAPAKFFAHAYIGYLYGTVLALRQQLTATSAADLLEILNNAVSDNPFLQRWLFTCLAVHIPFEEGPITIANAGHPSAWLSQQGGVSPITLRGPMPGLMPNTPYADATMRLHQGDRLVLHTDGIDIDASAMRATMDEKVPEAARRLFAGTSAKPDDATLLVIERVE